MAKIAITTKCWSSFCPSGIDSKKVLEKALSKAEKALSDQGKKSDDPKVADNCLGTLQSLPTTISKTIKECDKKKHKDEIKSLQEMKKLVDAEIARLEQVVKNIDAGGDGEEDDEDPNKLLDPKYMALKIKQLKSGKELYCALGFNKKDPKESDFLLHAKKNCKLLHKMLKKMGKYETKLMVFGYAIPDPEAKAKCILIKLDAASKVPPEGVIKKVGKEFCKASREVFKGYKKIRIQLPSGESFGSDDVDEETEAENVAQTQVTPEQKEEARREFTRIEEELRRMAAELNINV